jgi:short-subunit dehydrogenase
LGKLEGKVALVTGAARGIGAGIAQCLAAEGASIVILDLDLDVAKETAAGLGTPAIGIMADASDDKAMLDAAAQVVAAFGGLDIWVNNAGGGGNDVESMAMGPPFTSITQQGWDNQMQTNLRTVFAGSKAAIPHLKARGGGTIINIASIAGLMAIPTIPAYAAAKAGVISLTRSLALELGPDLIRVNAICPGFLYTRIWEFLAGLMKQSMPEYKDLSPREVFLDVVKRNTPMGREQTPADIGNLVAFLAGDGAANITGQEIKVDGGIMLNTMR